MPRRPSEKPAPTPPGAPEKGRPSTRPRPRLPTLVGVAPAAPIVVGKVVKRPSDGPPALGPNHGIAVDLRRFSRAPIEQTLLFGSRDEDGLAEGAAVDISLGGMFIVTETPAAFGTTIEIHTQLAGVRGEFVLPAVVRWTRVGGMGVQFGMLGAKETLAITEIVRKYEKAKRGGR